MTKLNGIEVKRRTESIMVPLPRELWIMTAFGDGCTCGKCGGFGYMDTLVISVSPRGMGRDTTMLCHAPEHHEAEYKKIRDRVASAGSVWHEVRPEDQQRIRCMTCQKPAEVCSHGATGGAPFFYYCMTHGADRGFSHELTQIA